ncbi:MAG: hypothetical protein ACPGVB_11470 [Chitinophagales bacterium]
MPSKEETSIELQERLQSLKDQLTAIPESLATEHNTLKANLLLEIGKAENKAENFEDALEHLSEGLKIVGTYSSESAEFHLETSTPYSGLSKLEEAEKEINSAIQIFNMLQDKVAQGKTLRQLAMVYTQQGKIEEAEKLIQKEIEQTTATENWVEAGKFYGLAGELASAKQDFQIAFNHFRNGIKALKKTTDNHETIGEYYSALARLLMHFKKSQEAVHSFEDGAVQFQLANKPLLQGAMLVLAAKVWEGEGKYLLAIPSLQEAATIFQKSDEESAAMQTADAYYQAAYLYEQEKQWENALVHYKLALPFAEQTEDEMFIASVEDSIEQCQEKLQAKKPSKKKNGEAKKGLFGKIKGMFGK